MAREIHYTASFKFDGDRGPRVGAKDGWMGGSLCAVQFSDAFAEIEDLESQLAAKDERIRELEGDAYPMSDMLCRLGMIGSVEGDRERATKLSAKWISTMLGVEEEVAIATARDLKKLVDEQSEKFSSEPPPTEAEKAE